MMGRSDKAGARRSARARWTRSFLTRLVLWGRMDMVRLKRGWMAALLAAFMSLFVLSSAVDAATCALEPAHSTSAEASFGSADTDVGDLGEDHAICSHGHCHHGGAPLPPAPEPTAATTLSTMTPFLPASEPLDSRTPSGPKRPPRA